MKPASTILWLACFIVGGWLGIRAGSPSQDVVHAAPDQIEAAAGGGTNAGTPSAARGATSNGAARGTVAKAAAHTPDHERESQATLDDLRQLLAINFYEDDLRSLMPRLEKTHERLPETDLPAAAALLAEAASRQPWAYYILSEVLSRWAGTQPEETLRWLKGLPADQSVPRQLRRNVLQSIGQYHPRLLWEEISQSQEWMQDDWFASGLVGQYFGKDPELARAFFDSIADPGVRDMAASSIASAWADNDPQGALAWAKSLPESNGKEWALVSALERIGWVDPQAALAILQADGATMTTAQRERLLSALAHKHPSEATHFISNGGLKAGMQNEAGATALYLSNTKADLLSLAQHIPAGVVRDAFLGPVAEQLAGQGDLPAATKALEAIGPGLERQSAMQGYGKAMAKKSTAEATTWLTSLPPGHDRDAAIRGFAYELNDTQPQFAAEWAAAVADPIYRADLLEDCYRDWRTENSKAAEAWLNSTTALSAADKEQLSKRKE